MLSPYHSEIHWPAEPCLEILMEMNSCKNSLKNLLEGNTYKLSMGYHVLALYFEQAGDRENRESILEKAINAIQQEPLVERKRWEFPVCYDEAFASDLLPLCKTKNLTKEEVIFLHSSPNYLLHFYGFLPGFMYLSGLDQQLNHPRKKTPERHIAAGSVAIGGQQTGVYPLQSPGGWHVIGRTPLILVNGERLPPFQPGDEITFKPILKNRFESMKGVEIKELAYECI
ncbi:5-oxoprolinase subunit B family protein [Pleomorphovibrio marinus]|uniref:5-oxoprolinase subunit B family protein n=1 Tax=Pleomorphovibrio marinus TaxID=2164132 RepID=UPI001300BCA0|nr:allophanate hydrolase subunit 1 [Pleomorphovibrio marinus]